MFSLQFILLAALVVITAAYLVFWIVRERSWPSGGPAAPGARRLLIGFVTNFFDALGIGSFATTTAMYRLGRMVSDHLIPGTLNVGHTLPTVTQALVYITTVAVAFDTLVVLIAAAVAGSWLGAGLVTSMSRRKIQIGMGVALLVAATVMTITAIQSWWPQIQILPLGGTALGLSGPKLIAAAAINFMLGALMTLGIGLYAPCMIMVSLLGMDPTAAFPIMMGSCAFLMPAASVQFIRKKKYDLRAAIGLAIGGIPASLIAALIVKSLPLQYVRWLVVIVVLYTATTMLRSAAVESTATGRRTVTL